jgi:hypothetical protein
VNENFFEPDPGPYPAPDVNPLPDQDGEAHAHFDAPFILGALLATDPLLD